MSVKRLFLFSVLILAQACAVSTAQSRSWSSISYEEEVLTETSYKILIVGSKFGITQVLAVAEGLCQYQTDISRCPLAYHEQYLSDGGGLILGQTYVEGVAFDRYKFWYFYIHEDGTVHRSLLPDVDGQAANPPYYSLNYREGLGVGGPHGATDMKGGLIIKLCNMSIVFVDGSKWTWNNTEVTITYVAQRIGESWTSTVSLNTTLPLQNVYNEATNTLTIYINTLPTLFWMHVITLTAIITIPTVTIIMVIWRKQKRGNHEKASYPLLCFRHLYPFVGHSSFLD